MPSPASKRDRHTSTTSSSFHFPTICSSLTPSFDLGIRHFSRIVLSLSTNLGSTLATAREVLTFHSRPGVGWKSGKLVKLPMEITQVTAWDFSLHSNYKGSLFNPLWATQRACSVKRANLQSNGSSFSGTWLYCGSRSSLWNKGRQNVTNKIYVSSVKCHNFFPHWGHPRDQL